MGENNSKLIHIGWEEYKFEDSIICKFNKPFHYGIYQIYGDHPIYGHNRLLYIGKAQDQTFSERLNNRADFKESIFYERISFICIGMLYLNDICNKDNWKNMISEVEKLLIKGHSPAYNSNGIKGLFNEVENITVFNWGKYRELLPEISTSRVSYEYWNFDNEGFIGDE